MTKIKVNGEERNVNLPLSVTDLLKIEKVPQPDMVSVEVNGEFLARNEFPAKQIAEGDEVEFLYFMGGGQTHD